jgi:hypothetical protein
VRATHEASANDRVPIPLDFPICFPSRRVSYLKPGGEVGAQPPHASALVLLGDAAYESRFAEAFAGTGRVTRRSAPV